MSPSPSPVSAGAAPVEILIVDDEPVVLSALKHTLERESFHVTACASPLKALAILQEKDFAVIISDQRMPEMSGLDFLVESRRLRPHASRMLITAVLAIPTIVSAINQGEIYRFVAKPWLREELVAAVRNAVQRHALVTTNASLLAETHRLNEHLRAANAQLEAKVGDLEHQRHQLDTANRELVARYEQSLELCRRILTAYDPILGGQSKALVDLVAKMAATDRFTPAERHALRTAAALCDLGLIGVPREMLRAFRQKSDQLTDHEKSLFHHHPIYSQTLAAQIDSRADVGEIIRAHHERFDGLGFPDHLGGARIPWAARCLAVAVSFLECGLPKAQALQLIASRAGQHYDPEAVRLFMSVSESMQLPKQVREISAGDLEPGMTLANGIYSPHGMLLIAENQALSPTMVSDLRDREPLDAATQRLLVYV